MNAPQVIIHNSHPSAGVSASLIRRCAALARKVLAAERTGTCQVSVVLVGNPAIRRLNRVYRRRDRATDVLAFGFYADRHTRARYGDIYISLDRARRQAAAYGVPYTQELLRLMVHGLLHLCGYDHRSSREEKALSRKVECWLRRGGRQAVKKNTRSN